MKEGKFLEMLVECLQKLLASDGIAVTRNERFYNSRRIQIGEVDIVLRGRSGSTNMVVGVECRDRREPQDLTWIQQIIGKRFHLAKFGFQHWIAVSASGFLPTARDLAEEASIILLVPGQMTAVEPDKIGPHAWMQYSITIPGWRPGEVRAMLEHDSEAVLAKIEARVAKGSWSIVSLSEPGEEPVPMYEFLQAKAEAYFREHELAESEADFTKTHVFEAAHLQGVIGRERFSIHQFSVAVTVYRETIHPNFRMMAFAVPDTRDILGIIGINEYRHHDTTMYLMVAMKLNDVDNPIMVCRDAEGNPIKGKIMFSMPVYPPGTPLRNIRFRVKP